jgi:RNA polymerase sigma-70 factor (ECF subfamily)
VSGRRGHIDGLYDKMARYVDGDRRAFLELYDLLSPRIRGFLMKLVRSDSVVDDLLQVTMLKAHLARERFTLQGGHPDGAVQGWYFAIARNVAMDHLRQASRSERRMVSRSDGSQDHVANLSDGAPSLEEIATHSEEETEIIEKVREAIAKLPPGQREVVELHKLKGLSMAQVASRLAIREGAVRVRAHRGYKALARLLSSSPEGALVLWWIANLLADPGGNA